MRKDRWKKKKSLARILWIIGSTCVISMQLSLIIRSSATLFLDESNVHQPPTEELSHDTNASLVSNATSQQHEYPPVAIFYHVFVSMESVRLKRRGARILQDQLQQIKESFLGSYHLHQHQPLTIYYSSIGQKLSSAFGKRMKADFKQSFFHDILIGEDAANSTTTIQITHLQHLESGYEDATLQKLYEFCQDHSEHRVVYMHNKGSFHRNRKQEKWRRHMTKAATSKECIQRSMGNTSDHECNVCGLLWFPIPAMHITGNIWSADCTYIQKLIPPILFEERLKNTTSYARQLVEKGVLQWHNVLDPSRPWNLGEERFAMEQWVGSHPSMHACDVSTTPAIKYWKTTPENELKASDWMWSMFPRHPSTTWIPERVLNSPATRGRDFFLLPGLVLKWLMLYDEIPNRKSWVWSWYPDGPKWFNLTTQHGIEALQINAQ